MKQFLRYTFRIAGTLLCLLLLLWVILAVFVEWKKDDLLVKARTEINQRITGNLGIGRWEISLFRHFPAVTIQLENVTLRDSGWSRHRHDLLYAERVDIIGAPFRSLFNGQVELNHVAVEHGTIYLFTDSSGYSNLGVLAGSKGEGGGDRHDVPAVSLTDVRLVVEKQDRHKLFDLECRRLNARIRLEDRLLQFDVNTEARARDFSFNTEKGSYIAGKSLSGHFNFTYNPDSHILQTEKAKLSIDGYPVVVSGRFFPTIRPDPFFLRIDAAAIPYREAAEWLTPHLREKLEQFDIDKPVSIHAQLDAGSADEANPQIQVRVSLTNGTVRTPSARFTGISFEGSFTNEWMRGRGRDDQNSAIRFAHFTGRLGDIPLRADSVRITDLTDPQLDCDLHSRFGLAALNDIFGSQTLQFRGGVCAMELQYIGPLSQNDSAGATIRGQLDLDSAALLYAPYQFDLNQINGRILFKDQDLVVDHLTARTGNTRFRINGVAKNLIALLDHNAENVSMDWTLSASHLDVEDLAVLAGRGGQEQSRHSPAAIFGPTAARIDNFLKAGLIHLRLDAADLSYGDFAGAHARADLSFRDHEIRLSQLTLGQSSGVLDLKADLRRHPSDGYNPLTLESHLDHVDLQGLFASFDNFGQKGITSHNLKGKMNADIKLAGLLTNRGKFVPNSLKGTVNFTITDGQLIDFAPMEKIHEKLLKKRDLSEIRFAPLENRLDIDSTTVTLHRMEIRSTAFTLYAQGTYDFKSGTDMSLQVPISNLKTRSGELPPESRGNDSKAGPSIRLRARTDDSGRLTVSWDPFRRALKKLRKP